MDDSGRRNMPEARGDHKPGPRLSDPRANITHCRRPLTPAPPGRKGFAFICQPETVPPRLAAGSRCKVPRPELTERTASWFSVLPSRNMRSEFAARTGRWGIFGRAGHPAHDSKGKAAKWGTGIDAEVLHFRELVWD